MPSWSLAGAIPRTPRIWPRICAAECPRTHHVESAAELDPVWFVDCETVGVTAGASTPDNQIDSVVRALETM
ncbi:MAG: hypothetical protein V8T51_04065 [Senegalimassilia faecalis]